MPVASIPQHFAVFIPRQRDQLGAPTPLALHFTSGPLCGRPTLPPGNPVISGYKLGCKGPPNLRSTGISYRSLRSEGYKVGRPLRFVPSSAVWGYLRPLSVFWPHFVEVSSMFCRCLVERCPKLVSEWLQIGFKVAGIQKWLRNRTNYKRNARRLGLLFVIF